MKIIKWISLTLLLVMVLFLVAGLLLPKTIDVSVSREIDVPQELVVENVTNLRKMDSWSPWYELDTTQQRWYTGDGKSIGSIAHWKGNDDVGSGTQTISNITANSFETKLAFLEPWESESDASISWKKTVNGTEVTWGFSTEAPFPMNVMMYAMGMKSMLAKDFNRGLDLLQAILEEERTNRVVDGFVINTVNFPATTMIYARKKLAFEKVPAFFGAEIPKMYKAINQESLTSGLSYGIYYGWDEVSNKTDVAVAVASSAPIKSKEYKSMSMGGKALSIAFYGTPAASAKAHNAIDKYMQINSVGMNGPVVEEHVTDTRAEPDTSKWLTNIFYFVE